MTDNSTPPARSRWWAADPVLGWTRATYGPRWLWLFGLYLALATTCGYTSWSKVVIDDQGQVYTNQTTVDTMVSVLSDNPEGLARFANIRSRVLVPLLMASANKYLGVSYRVAHDGMRLMFILMAVLAFHWYLRTWFSPLESLVGTILVLASITITFNTWFPRSTDFPELLGMTLCAGLLVRRRWAWMFVALAIMTLNRETSIIFLLAAACWLYAERFSSPKIAVVCAAIFLTWAAAFFIARQVSGVGAAWILGPESTSTGRGLVAELVGVFLETWPRRAASMLSLIQNPHPYNVNWSLLLVLNVFWFLPLSAWRFVPANLRALYVGGLLGGFLIFALVGVLNEAGRHMIPLYPLLYPAGLFVIFRYVAPAREWGVPGSAPVAGARVLAP